MPAFRWLLSLVTVLLALSAGCRCPSCRTVCPPPVAPCAFEPTEPTAAPDLPALIPFEEASPADSLCLLPGPIDGYDLLDRGTCQCHAATNTVVANAVLIEKRWAEVLIDCEEGAVEESLCLTRSLLALQAADLRNTAAASALTSFYLLAGVEAQEEYLRRGIAEVEATLRRVDSLRSSGLEVPKELDRDEVAARLDDLEDKRLQLGAARVQLNGQLKRSLGCPLDQRRFFWPSVQWAPNLSGVDVNAAVDIGLANRTDLRSLRLVRCKLNKATVPIARIVLQVADGSLGTVTPTSGIVHKLRCGDCYKQEVSVRCRQLTMLERDTEQLAIGKIKSAACKVAVQQDRVRLARAAVEHRRNELTRLEKLRDVEDRSIFEVSVARGRLFDAESALVTKVVELKVAEVALREVQHLLAVDCGYGVAICGEHCCTGECGGCGCRGGCSACGGLTCCGEVSCN
ncbi:MAG: hypothetical protein AAGJ46_19995 [Planctomycetota bacterium]